MKLREIIMLYLGILVVGFSQEQRVYGGKPVTEGEFPFMTSLQRREKNGGGAYQHHCGASLIDKNWAITAGHCVLNYSQYEYTLKSNIIALDATNDVITWQVNRIVLHPSFSQSNGTSVYDIALLELNTISNGYSNQIIRFPWKDESINLSLGERLTSMGWGKTEHATGSNILLKVLLPMMDNTAAQTIFNQTTERWSILPSMLVAGGIENEDTCAGDSGGPLIKTYKDDYYLVGIVSKGISCGTKGMPGVYTRASYFSDWIEKQTGVRAYFENTYNISITGDSKIDAEATYYLPNKNNKNKIIWEVSDNLKIQEQDDEKITVLAKKVGEGFICAYDETERQELKRPVEIIRTAISPQNKNIRRGGCSK